MRTHAAAVGYTKSGVNASSDQSVRLVSGSGSQRGSEPSVQRLLTYICTNSSPS